MPELTEPDSDLLSSLLVHLWVLPCRVSVDSTGRVRGARCTSLRASFVELRKKRARDRDLILTPYTICECLIAPMCANPDDSWALGLCEFSLNVFTGDRRACLRASRATDCSLHLLDRNSHTPLSRPLCSLTRHHCCRPRRPQKSSHARGLHGSRTSTST